MFEPLEESLNPFEKKARFRILGESDESEAISYGVRFDPFGGADIERVLFVDFGSAGKFRENIVGGIEELYGYASLAQDLDGPLAVSLGERDCPPLADVLPDVRRDLVSGEEGLESGIGFVRAGDLGVDVERPARQAEERLGRAADDNDRYRFVAGGEKFRDPFEFLLSFSSHRT